MASIILRLKRLVKDPDYPRVLLFRFLSGIMRRLFPELTLFGIENKHGLLLLRAGDATITPYCVARGHFQKDTLDKVIGLLGRSPGPGLFIDVGANIGSSSVYGVRSGYFDRAHLVEPVAKNVDVIRLNMLANGIQAKISPVAVSDYSGSTTIHLSPINAGDNRIGRMSDSEGWPEEVVEVTTLERLEISLNPERDLIWMDVQGHEGKALAGATSLLATGTPLCMEFWPYGLRSSGSWLLLTEILPKYFDSVIDLNTGRWFDPSQLEQIADLYEGPDQGTDLLCMN